MLHWPGEDEMPNTMDYLREKKIDLVINIPKNLSSKANSTTITASAAAPWISTSR